MASLVTPSAHTVKIDQFRLVRTAVPTPNPYPDPYLPIEALWALARLCLDQKEDVGRKKKETNSVMKPNGETVVFPPSGFWPRI